MKALPDWLAPLGAIAGATILAGLFLLLLGADPAAALRALARGAFGDAVALENTLIRMGPLVLVGLGMALAFRCGVWNIGGEGQLYAGALADTGPAGGAGAQA